VLVSVGGAPLLFGRLIFPRIGAWSAKLTIESPTAPSGAIAVESDDGAALRLAGTAERAEAFHGRTSLRIVGGAGGLGTRLPPRAFSKVPLRIPLADALSVAGERAAPTPSPSLELPRWTRAESTAGEEIAALAHVAHASWRLLDDGSVWLGTETWPAAGTELEALAADDAARVRTYRASDLLLRPGTVADGRALTLVVYRFSPHEVLVDAWS
jgi:hypothetical protein